ncbi:LytTR family two component transcriptional regulator [Lutibacter sp. Hel_I_33_5]|uniref:LytR/AlgR family response regulator transcription factor n=1 Tax=Lutibacter sp. Hel_I_33_5 TaxID=1566289 RepID=UPI0011A09F8E|nr:LytTR family DNA-binding domain-containing protein [Lutibacter sp. Hel_I_33_5]TVZ54904.1 LytTR family two component transcriptional regulator [Lutibacter sp. Hel_I_33_5]
MKTRVCIIDDEQLAINELTLLLSDYSDIEVCATAKSATEAISIINKNKPDIVFLDIQLKETNAFTIIDKIKVKTHIIFVTAYDEYAVRAFKINALDYLLKPVLKERLSESINRFYTKVSPKKVEELKYKYSDRIIINQKNEFKLISINEIIAITADGDYTCLLLKNDSKKLVLKPLSDWEKLLPYQNFERIHRSTIINLDAIDKIEKSFNNTCKVFLKNNPLPFQMSQRFTSKFLNKYKA